LRETSFAGFHLICSLEPLVEICALHIFQAKDRIRKHSFLSNLHVIMIALGETPSGALLWLGMQSIPTKETCFAGFLTKSNHN
jgi:hypothetical protein